MKFDLGHINKIVVLKILMKDEEYDYSLQVLKLKKGEIKLDAFIPDIPDEKTLFKKLKNKGPVLLHFQGKGVLNRTVQNEPGYRDHLLMSGNTDDFYFTDILKEGKVHCSIIRKDIPDELLKKLKEKEFHVVQITSGILVVGILKQYLNKEIIGFGDFALDLEKDWKIIKEPTRISSIELEGEQVQAHQLESIAAGTLFFTKPENVQLSEQEEVYTVNYEEARQKNIFNRFGFSLMVVFLLVISANYMYLGQLNQEISLNYIRLSEFEEQLTRLAELEEEKDRKEKLLRTSGLLNHHFLSFYLAELGNHLPYNLRFDEFVVRPLIDDIKNKHKVEFQDQLIRIKGRSENSQVLSEWIEKIKQDDWILSVEILNYSYEKDEGNFELEIVVI